MHAIINHQVTKRRGIKIVLPTSPPLPRNSDVDYKCCRQNSHRPEILFWLTRHKHLYSRQGPLARRHIRLTSLYTQNHARHISRHPHPRRRAQYRPGSRSELCLQRLQGCPRSPVTEGGRQHGQSTEHYNRLRQP
jgi:hypothetical protein